MDLTPTQALARARRLPPSTDQFAWLGGVWSTPVWRRWLAIDSVDRAGFHAILRWAGLPEAELRFMSLGYSTALSERGSLVPCEAAAYLLGRIAWDMVYGDRCGTAFDGSAEQTSLVYAMGRQVLDRWFVSGP